MRRQCLKLAFFILLGIMLPLHAYTKNINIVVNATSGNKQALIEWQPMIDYLNSNIPAYHFNLIPIKPIDLPLLKHLLDKKEIHYLITQPAIYVDLELSHGISRIMTMVKHGGYSEFGSVFITHRLSDIETLEDFKGKTIAGVAKMGFGGWLIGHKEMIDHGFDPFKQAKVTFLGNQLSQIMAVKNRDVDVAVIRTGMLEKFARQGDIELSDFKVIAEKKYPDFNYLASTKLYPEWAFAKTPEAPRELSKLLVSRLLNLPDGSDIAQKAGFQEWTLPYDYKPVHDLLRDLQVGPYEDFEKVTFQAMFEQHKAGVIIIICFTISLVLMSILLFSFNRKLHREKGEKECLLEKMRDMATHDSLTGLPNRMLFMEFLSKMSHYAHRQEQMLAVMFVDLDGFKEVNDQFGHAKGDEILKKVSTILQHTIRAGDICARFGGDEFVVALTPIHDEGELKHLAQRILMEICDLIDFPTFGASIGIVYGLPAENQKLDTLLQHSDTLMYQVKHQGKNHFLIEKF